MGIIPIIISRMASAGSAPRPPGAGGLMHGQDRGRRRGRPIDRSGGEWPERGPAGAVEKPVGFGHGWLHVGVAWEALGGDGRGAR